MCIRAEKRLPASSTGHIRTFPASIADGLWRHILQTDGVVLLYKFFLDCLHKGLGCHGRQFREPADDNATSRQEQEKA
jgi:hypothetical protein